MDFDRAQQHSNNDEHNLEIKDNFLMQTMKYFSRESVGVRIIFIIGVLSVLLGSWKMLYGIKNSFVSSPIALKDNVATIQALNSLKDTDGDGISDSDELDIYGTSPYLVDTNSNGMSDYEEVVLGKGNNCTDVLSCSANYNLSVVSASSSVFGEAINYDDIKKQMLDAGYSQEVVDQIAPSSQGSASSSVSNDDWTKLQNLSAKEIRALLIEQGATEEELSQFSDEQIRAIYIQALNEQSSKNQ